MKELIDKIYAENMWIKDCHYRALMRCASDENYDRQKLYKVIDDAAESAKMNFIKVFSRMGNKEKYYQFEKNIFIVGDEEHIVIKGKYKYQRLAGSFKVVVSPVYDYDYHSDGSYEVKEYLVEAQDNKISIPYVFEHEDMYIVNVFFRLDGEEMLLLSSKIYALNEDMRDLYYYKADFHIHTTYSDGYEPPEHVVVAARKKGMDVVAITDHNNFEGSVVAKEMVSELGLDMTVVLGEEYSLEYSPMHILALGTKTGVDNCYKSKAILDLEETKNYKKTIDKLDCDINAYVCTQVLLEEVKRLGGISILAHPYWKPISSNGSRIDTPEKLYVELAKDKKFDGIELVSGSALNERKVSNLQSLLAREILNDFDNVPLIGISDSHFYSSDDVAGNHYTIVFSADKSEDSVISALKNGKCVAVENNGENVLCYGNFRYVKFAYFLIEYYFPRKDELSYLEAKNIEENILMRR